MILLDFAENIAFIASLPTQGIPPCPPSPGTIAERDDKASFSFPHPNPLPEGEGA